MSPHEILGFALGQSDEGHGSGIRKEVFKNHRPKQLALKRETLQRWAFYRAATAELPSWRFTPAVIEGRGGVLLKGGVSPPGRH
ncbi:hypothetical protein JTE90_001965, partial [Oedothorax gibbosus]